MATLGTFAAFSSKGYSGTGSSIALPTGGSIIENNGSGKRVHVFTSSGTFTIPENVLPGTFEAEVLVIGGGGSAGTPWGGGGGGGGVVYDSSFRFGANMAFQIVVGGAGGTSRMFGLPAAPGGGVGGGQGEYSKGQSGGCGGGGSWQNGTPNGPDRSTANPGAIWGSTGPTPPGTFSPALTLVPLGPDYSPFGSVTRDYRDRFHDVGGNGNYRNTSATPSNDTGTIPDVGYASDSPFRGNSWRARGGGGTSFVGGLGGQGVATRFIDRETAWRWIGSGGHGVSGRNYWGRASETNSQWWRDSIVVGGFHYGNTITTGSGDIAGVGSTRSETGYDDVAVGALDVEPAGRSGYGSGGHADNGNHNVNDGRDGIVVIRYDLSAYPGGLAAASANIFGGTISLSANGKYRYHTFTTTGDGPGRSSNSYTWYINSDYHPRSFPTSTTDVEIAQANPGANIQPFYYYGEMPATIVDYMIVGAGGSTGTRGSAPESVHFGGGGSGGIRAGTLTLSTDGIDVDDESTPSESLANSQQHIFSSCRPGFIEVYVNGLFANNRLHPRQYVYSASTTAENTDPSNNATAADFQPHIRKSRYITLRGRWGANTAQQAKVIRKVYSTDIGSGYWGNTTDGSAGPDANKAFFTINGPLSGEGNPGSDPNWGDSLHLSSFDHFFYPDYTRVWVGPMEGAHESEVNIPRNQSGVLPSSSSNYNYTGSELTYEGANIHPNTPQRTETYYTTLKINRPLCKWSRGKNASDVSDTIWNRITGNNLHNFAETNRELVLGPNHTYLGTTNYGTTNVELKIQWVIENSTGASSRRFVYIENGYDTNQFGVYTLPAGWRFVDLRSGSSTRQGATAAIYGVLDSGIRMTRIQIYRKDLRRFYVRKIPCYDISVGSGGGGGFWAPSDRRFGGISGMKEYTSSTFSSPYMGGRGGAGGWWGYTADSGSPGTGVPTDQSALLSTFISDSNARGSGGGGAWDQRQMATGTPSDNTGSNNGSPSRSVEPFGAGASGGGAFTTRNISSFAFVGATRGGTFSDGRRNNRNSPNDLGSGHGGRGFFGGSGNWAYETRTLGLPEGTFYYYINVNQYPHNGNFGAGGGGGGSGNGGNATTSGTGGSGGPGYVSAITGYSITYSHGGGGWGRKRNGPPGSGQPANPADQTFAPGALDSPVYLPYGGGGGWSAGAQEGFGSSAVSYYPGNQPWPLAYNVTLGGEEHMDAMRFWNSNVPAPQRGNLGTAYSGKQGVVIIAYNRAPFIYAT